MKRNLGDNQDDGALTLGDASARDQGAPGSGSGIGAGGRSPVLSSREVRFTGYAPVLSGQSSQPPGWNDPGREQIG